MKLRSDERQWLIYQEPKVVAAVRAIEMIAMLAAGPALARHPDIEVRAIGNVMESVADARVRFALGLLADNPDDDLRTAAHHAITITSYLQGVLEGKPAVPADELHAAVVWLDSTLKSAGLNGPGWFRELARGER